MVISPPFEWQVRLNASRIEPLPRIDEPVADAVLDILYQQLPDFRRAYDIDGMTPAQFQDYGATRKTLRQQARLQLAARLSCSELRHAVQRVHARITMISGTDRS